MVRDWEFLHLYIAANMLCCLTTWRCHALKAGADGERRRHAWKWLYFCAIRRNVIALVRFKGKEEMAGERLLIPMGCSLHIPFASMLF